MSSRRGHQPLPTYSFEALGGAMNAGRMVLGDAELDERIAALEEVLDNPTRTASRAERTQHELLVIERDMRRLVRRLADDTLALEIECRRFAVDACPTSHRLEMLQRALAERERRETERERDGQ